MRTPGKPIKKRRSSGPGEGRDSALSPVLEAAMVYKGIVYRGKRHNDCIHKAHLATGDLNIGGTQGFMDLNGLFLTRKEAAKRAFLCGQIKKEKEELFSEDLY